MTTPSNLPRPPANLEPFVEVLGVDGAVEFFLAFGGSEIYLPANPKGRGAVERLVGSAKARQLYERLDQKLRVPGGKKWIARILYHQGTSVVDICRTLHMSDTTVRAYLKGDRADPRQGSLF